MNQRPDGTYYITVYNTRIGRFKTEAKSLEARAWVDKTRYRTLKALKTGPIQEYYAQDPSRLIEDYLDMLRARYPDRRAKRQGLIIKNGKPYVTLQHLNQRYTLGPLRSEDHAEATYKQARHILDTWASPLDPTNDELETLTLTYLAQAGEPTWR